MFKRSWGLRSDCACTVGIFLITVKKHNPLHWVSSVSFLTFLSFTHFHCNTLLHSRQVSEKMDEDIFWPLNNSENVNLNESRSNIKEMSILSIYLRSLALYRNCNSFKVCLLVNVWWESVFLSSLNVTWVSFNSTCNVFYCSFRYICNK